MNILFINNFRGRGGGEEFLNDLLPGLVQKGVTVGLVCRPGTPLEKMFQGTGVNVYPIKRSGTGFFTSVFRIAKIIRRDGYEIVNIQRGHDILQSWFAAILSLKRSILIYTVQIPEFIRSRFLLSRMDRITTISRYIAEKISSYAPSMATRVSILYYGIDLSTFKPETGKSGCLRRRFGVSRDTFIIGTVGDLWKNQIEFLDALDEIRKELPDTRFALVANESDNGDVRKFKDRAAELGLTDAILWAGRLSKDDMLSFYADIDLAVSTHRNEGFGIWVLEAMAMAKPAVAFNAGGIRDSLENCPAGVLVNGGAREMATQIVRILNNDARYKQMSEAGPLWVADRFNRDRMVEEYYRFFETLASSGRKKSEHGVAPLNILQIISKNDRYGAQRVFLDQVKILHQMGHAVFVVTRGTEGYVTDSARAMGIPCYGIPMKGLKDIFFLKKFLKEYKIDVIHSSLDRADHFGVLLSWLTRRPVISTMHVRRYHTGLRLATKIVVSSHQQENALKAKGIKPGKIHLIRPGIDVDRFASPDPKKRDIWKEKLGIDRYSIILCHIASLIPRKAQTVSIDLAAECKKRGEEPLLIIIGDPLEGAYYESLVQKITDLGLKRNVAFTGWTSEIPEILSLSHFTVLPSENEALGIVLLEGMAAGTPIVAREGEGGAEVIEEYGCGFLYKPSEGVAAIAEKTVALCGDRERYEALSAKCRKTAAAQFYLQRFGERLIKLYRFIEK
jgi:glycosyltransferase involved in cell wall biosynthesis